MVLLFTMLLMLSTLHATSTCSLSPLALLPPYDENLGSQYLCILEVAYARVSMRIRWTNKEIMWIMVRKKASIGFLLDNGKDLRPTYLLLFNWLQGKDAWLDVTDISPFAGMREFDMKALDTLSHIKSISISHSNNAKSGAFIFHRVGLCIQKGVGA
ncbi:hypothetical protein Tco_1173894 [Tanacetum coccineum]